MNILFLDQFSDLGGAQRCLLDLLPAVRERGWRAFLAAPGSGPLLTRAAEAGASVEPFSGAAYSCGRKTARDALRFLLDLPHLSRWISRRIEELGIDLVYVNGPRLVPAAALATGRRVPLVFHCHSYLGRWYASMPVGLGLRRARATVVACCRFVTGPLARWAPEERLHIVYNGVSDTAAGGAERRADGRRVGGWRVGMVGRIAPEKGQREFLEAARLLAGEVPDCRFVLCGKELFGDDASRRYANRMRRLAEGIPVEFTGWIEDTAAVYASLDLLVVPSGPEEATTRVIPEAFAAGLPVIAYRAGGIPEIVTEGETGFLVEPAKPEALARRIRELLTDAPDTLRRAGVGARREFERRFTLACYRERMLALIGRAAGILEPAEQRAEQQTGRHGDAAGRG